MLHELLIRFGQETTGNMSLNGIDKKSIECN